MWQFINLIIGKWGRMLYTVYINISMLCLAIAWGWSTASFVRLLGKKAGSMSTKSTDHYRYHHPHSHLPVLFLEWKEGTRGRRMEKEEVWAPVFLKRVKSVLERRGTTTWRVRWTGAACLRRYCCRFFSICPYWIARLHHRCAGAGTKLSTCLSSGGALSSSSTSLPARTWRPHTQTLSSKSSRDTPTTFSMSVSR